MRAPVVRDITRDFEVHPTMDRTFIYTILGGRIDPAALYHRASSTRTDSVRLGVTLSLVIPAYNEAGRIGGTVARVCEYLDRQPYDWELIVVIDGGSTAAADEARAAAGRDRTCASSTTTSTAARATRCGADSTRRSGERLVFIDADLSLPIEGLEADDGALRRRRRRRDRVAHRAGLAREGAPPPGAT